MLDALGPVGTGALLAGDRMEYRLGDLIAEGGQGRVFTVKDRDDIVAKLYKEPDYRRAERLEALLDISRKDLRAVAAWPMSLLRDPTDEVVGFVMESLRTWHPLYEVYGIRSRLQLLPNKNWAFLVRVARNLSAAVARMHASDIVIGDLNESNVLIDGQAMVKLIDVDSCQIRAHGKLHACGVGKSELLPPELQGRSLEGLERTIEHDRFALAVLIFETLVFGRHPFAGRPLDAREIGIEQAILNGWYPFARSPSGPMAAPPFLSLDWLPEEVRSLFERAFALGAPSRPSPEDWYDVLQDLEVNLQACAENSSHVHWRDCERCPWCELEDHWSISLFAPVSILLVEANKDLDLDAIWRDIELVPVPTLPELHRPLTLTHDSLVPEKLPRWRRFLARASTVPFLYILPAQIAGFHRFAFFFAVWLVALVVALGFRPAGGRRRVTKAEKALQELGKEWDQTASDGVYRDALHDLKEARDDLRDPSGRLERLRRRKLEERFKPHLDAFLEKYSVLAADAELIGADRLTHLYESGYRSAADLSEGKLRRSMRLNDDQVGHLMTWRRSLELRFWETTSHQLSPSEEHKLMKQLREEDKDLRERLLRGREDLTALGDEIRQRREDLSRRAEPLIETILMHGPRVLAYEQLAVKRKN